MSVVERAATRLVAQNTEASVTCPAWTGHTLLGRFTAFGAALYCKHCKDEHLVSWEEMERLRCLLLFGEIACQPDHR